MFRVGRNENLFIFFWKATKIAGSAQKTGSVGLAEIQVFLGLRITSEQGTNVTLLFQNDSESFVCFRKFLFHSDILQYGEDEEKVN